MDALQGHKGLVALLERASKRAGGVLGDGIGAVRQTGFESVWGGAGKI